jgi:sulfite exporter TauE/SafE
MNPTTFLGGALIGLGGSLHCAGMCGGISSAIVLSTAKSIGLKARLATLASAQAGKTLAYVLAGGVLGAAGASLYGLFDPQAGHMALQWLGASALVWIGLSMLGIVPASAGYDRVLEPVRRWAWSTRRRGHSASALAGLAWGLMPCSMVYSALMFAMLAGSAVGGAAAMLGFALGTVPSVTVATLGVSQLQRLSRTPGARLTVGGGLILLGIGTLVVPAVATGLCRF